jgi:hypothetical protein
MPSKNIKIKRRTSTDLSILYPELPVAQLQTAENTPISVVSQKIAKANVSGNGAGLYMRIVEDNDIDFVMTPESIGGIAASHTHPISLFAAGSIGGGKTLQQWLDSKVPIVGGKVPSEYWPDNIKGHMKFQNTIALSGTATTLATLASGAFGALATDPLDKLGRFLIVTNPGIVSETSDHHFIVRIDEEPETNPNLEAGDWIVFVEYISSPLAYKFAIVNNVYEPGSTGRHGIVKLAPINSRVTRAELSNTTDATKVVAEGLARSILKDIKLTKVVEYATASGNDFTRVVDQATLNHTSSTATSTTVSGTLNEIIYNFANGNIYECTVVGAGIWTWLHKGVGYNVPSAGFQQTILYQNNLYMGSSVISFRVATGASPKATGLAIYELLENDIVFDDLS